MANDARLELENRVTNQALDVQPRRAADGQAGKVAHAVVHDAGGDFRIIGKAALLGMGFGIEQPGQITQDELTIAPRGNRATIRPLLREVRLLIGKPVEQERLKAILWTGLSHRYLPPVTYRPLHDHFARARSA